LPKDFINFKLTGAVATDHSEGSGSLPRPKIGRKN
jgi:sugar (pentulose or hexulose) kinase